MNSAPILRFRVYGSPKGQPRPRAFAKQVGGRFMARVYDAGTAEGWKGDVALAAQACRPDRPIDDGVRVDATFLFARPARLCRKKDPPGRIPHLSKPDRDNLDKAVLDCLVRVGVLADDCLVFGGQIWKFYAAIGEAPGAEIVISRLAGAGATCNTGTPMAAAEALFDFGGTAR